MSSCVVLHLTVFEVESLSLTLELTISAALATEPPGTCLASPLHANIRLGRWLGESACWVRMETWCFLKEKIVNGV